MSEHKTVRIIVGPLLQVAPPPEKPVSITINGVTQEVPVGVEVDVREDMLEALTNSDRTYTLVDPPEPDRSDAGGATRTPPAGASDGQENTPAARSGPDDLHAPHVDKDTTGFRYAPVAGALGAESGEDGAVPSTPLTAEEQVAEQTGEGGDAPLPGPTGGSFDADQAIDGNISLVTQRLPNLSAEELDEVLLAEKDREQPRKGVMDAVAAAKKALADKTNA